MTIPKVPPFVLLGWVRMGVTTGCGSMNLWSYQGIVLPGQQKQARKARRCDSYLQSETINH